jgi:hypothetical protein
VRQCIVRNIVLGWCAALALSLTVSSVVAAPPLDIEAQLRQMQQEMHQLRDENRAMRSEIDELRAATRDDWMTEQRAAEIRAIVGDVLADADTRASLLGDGLLAGWHRRDGFFLASADGLFKLNLSGHMQFRFLYNYHDEPPAPGANFGQTQAGRHKSGFENTRTRLAFSGHVFDRNLTYFIRGAFQRDSTQTPQSGGFFLQDAWIRYHLNNELSVRIGQFKLPFTREFLVSAAHQLAVERSVIDTDLNVGRSQGIELTWATNIYRFSGAYHDGGVDNLAGPLQIAAFHNPQNSAALRTGAEYAWTFRNEFLLAGNWAQFEDMTSPIGDDFGVMLGVAGHIQRTEALGIPPGLFQPPQRRDIKWYAYTIDASFEFGGASLHSSFTHHYVDQPERNINIFGVVVQGGYYFTPKVEAFARYEYGKWSFPAPFGSEDFIRPLHLLTTGFNYYLDGHDVKWTTDIGVAFTQVGRGWGRNPAGITGLRSERPGARPQVIFRTQLQLMF